MSGMMSAGVFGPKLSGKTTLAKKLSREYWVKEQRRSIILDPNAEEWGDHALVMQDEPKFWETIWQTQNDLIIVDEASTTIKRDKSLIGVFTRLRHLNHKLIVIGHNGMNLLPIMREQFDTLYLFRQPEGAAKVWSETFTQKELLVSPTNVTELNQYEFVYARLYHKPRKLKLKL